MESTNPPYCSDDDDYDDDDYDDEDYDDEPPHDLEVDHFHKVNSLILREDYTELLKLASDKRSVNLMEDHLLSVVITHGKTDLALRLIQDLPVEILDDENFDGDTALHIAATIGDCQVAKGLLNKNVDLVRRWNKKQETPLHKAALYGQRDMFWCLLEECPREDREFLSNMRREDGAKMLHCAIMGNAPALALEIAREFPEQITSRNDVAVTPLQLMVTIPEAFRSQLVLGPLDDFLYKCIPLESDDYVHRRYNGDEEKARPDSIVKPTTDAHDDVTVPLSKPLRSKFPSQYDILFDLFELMMHFPVRWIQWALFNFLRPLWSRIGDLEKQKKIHKQAMDLVEHLALHPGYFDFFPMGHRRDRSTKNHGPFADQDSAKQWERLKKKLRYCIRKILWDDGDGNDKRAATAEVKGMIRRGRELLESVKEEESDRTWYEPPLTLGVRMGLDEYVIKIIDVYPQSATLLDTEGRNVLQVAIQYGRSKIVGFIKEKFQEKNPILPSWLLSRVHRKTANTILHFASEKVIDADEDDAFALREELKWFELIKKMVPKELVNSRNGKDKTARETFTENHTEMLKRCKNKLIETGKACSGLVAAVVFASSFSIPGGKDSKELAGTLAFKIFSRAYLIGVSCAATSLVLFMSLVISPYKEQQFRRAIPTTYFFAVFSFGLAMAALLLSFTCNAFLQLYGPRTETKQAVEIGLELTVFPIATFLVLLYRGSTFRVLWFRGLWE